jgi:hypothetical protein
MTSRIQGIGRTMWHVQTFPAASLVAGLAALTLSCLTPQLGWAEETGTAGTPRAMLVLDSTVDMRPLFGSETKLLAVGNAIANVLPTFEQRLDLGLLVYGHHSSGDGTCAGTFVPRAPIPIVSADFADTLSTLKAKGNAAVKLALEGASGHADMVDVSGTIIMIAGGPDQCREDPCAAGASIAAGGAHKVHVIAVDAGTEASTLESLRCVATLTGGTFWQVTSPLELAAALDQALSLAAARPLAPPGLAKALGAPATSALGLDSGSDAATALLEDTVAGASAAGPKEIVGNGVVPVQLTALLTDGGPQLTTGLTWRVFEKPLRSSDEPKLVATSKQAIPDFRLPVGEFMINVAYGRANLVRSIAVTGGPLSEQFVLNAGGLRFSAEMPDGTKLSPSTVLCDIYSDDRDQTGDRIRVVAGARLGTILRLNAGIYYVSSLYGDANAVVQAEVGVEAGKLTEAKLTHTGSTVTLKLVTQRGGEALAETRWTITTPDGNVVKESVGALPSHILAAGRYTAQATRGADTVSKEFVVLPGKSAQVELVFKPKS